MPVFTTSHLLMIQSNLFQFQNGSLVMNSQRVPPTIPLIKLGKYFQQVLKKNFFSLLINKIVGRL